MANVMRSAEQIGREISDWREMMRMARFEAQATMFALALGDTDRAQRHAAAAAHYAHRAIKMVEAL